MRFTRDMPSAEHCKRAAVGLAVVVGAGLVGVSLGDMARVDRELQAATAAPARLRFAVEREAAGPSPVWCEREERVIRRWPEV